MLYVSIVVELLRARPALAVAIAALLQAAVWTLVPTLFYAAPPGDVPTVLAVAVEAGWLLLTSSAALLLIGLLALFTALHPQARAVLHSPDPWVAGVAVAFIAVPHLVWLAGAGAELMPVLVRLRAPEAVLDNLFASLGQIAVILAAHAGVVLLVALVTGWPRWRTEPAPMIVRVSVGDFARHFIYFFAIVPVLAATFVAVIAGSLWPVGG